MKGSKEKQSKKRLEAQGDKIWYNIIIDKIPRCEVCCQPATQIHHFFYKSSSPALRWDLENGIALCQGCHFLLHVRDPKLMEVKIIAKRGQEWYLGLLAKSAIKMKHGYKTKSYLQQQLQCLKENA